MPNVRFDGFIRLIRSGQRTQLAFVLLAVLMYVYPVIAVGQSAEQPVSGADGASIITASRVETSITLDGRLDEGEWDLAEPISGFSQTEPLDGAPATQETEVRVLYGEDNLYIGAILHDSDPNRIEAALGRRDDYNRADWFLVSIDSYFDRKTAYVFGLNAAGVQFDAIRSGGRGGFSGGGGGGGGGGGSRSPRGTDPSWDAIWFSSQRVTPEGWIAEVRIPYSMLRFPAAESQTWGIHFMRSIPRLGEESEWPYVPRVERANLVAQFGHLVGIDNVKPKRNIQITPYTVTRHLRQEDGDSPGSIVGSSSFDVGGDFKIGLGTNVTLDATINPDFGQVESDPAVLNLTAFEISFREKRPFFLEGMQIFDVDVGRGRQPYTRRIGASAPIIGAAKLSGRTSRGLSFGLLSASTGENLNPTRHYEIARLSQQIGEYSSIGSILTAYDGPIEETPGRHRSFFGGVDYDIRFLNNVYNFAGFVGFVRNWETTPGATAETGYGIKALFTKRQGVLTGWTGFEGYDQHFDINAVGQLRQINYFTLPFRVQYEINGGQPFGPFLQASVSDFAAQDFTAEGKLNAGQWHRFSARGTLKGFQQISLDGTFRNVFGGYDIYETRGLGAYAEPASTGIGAQFETDSRRNWQLEPQAEVTFNNGGGTQYQLGLRGNLNLGSRLSLSASVEGELEDDVLAWSSNETFLRSGEDWLIGLESSTPDADAFDAFTPLADAGALDAILSEAEPYAEDRYHMPVFGVRDTRSIDFTLRNTTTFTPNLSLQIYGQLLLARGRYADFQILRDRDNLVAFDAFPKRDEFSLSSLQSNVVLRWEYRPGSTLYLVWTQGRSLNDELNPLMPWRMSPYDQALGDQFSGTFDILPTNVFLMKINYTFLN